MATKKKSVKVTRQFLLGLANDIYDPSTRRFLRLCTGTLQNGPDPVDGERTMHCGLGELYFAMTGKQPRTAQINEEGVCDLAVELSDLSNQAARGRASTIVAIKALDISDDAKESLISSAEMLDDCSFTAEEKFHEILSGIPQTNDSAGSCGSGGRCSRSAYRSRSAQVARKLRAAAMLLPE